MGISRASVIAQGRMTIKRKFKSGVSDVSIAFRPIRSFESLDRTMTRSLKWRSASTERWSAEEPDAARKKRNNRRQSKPCLKDDREGGYVMVEFHARKNQKGGR